MNYKQVDVMKHGDIFSLHVDADNRPVVHPLDTYDHIIDYVAVKVEEVGFLRCKSCDILTLAMKAGFGGCSVCSAGGKVILKEIKEFIPGTISGGIVQ